MRIAELSLTAAVILGCIFKIMHWPGANILILSGGGLLALFYFPFGFRTLPAPKPTEQILWLTVAGGASLCVALLGLVAFQLKWANNSKLMVSGAVGCVLTLLFGLILRFKHPRLEIYFDGLSIRCLVLGGLVFTLWILFAGMPR